MIIRAAKTGPIHAIVPVNVLRKSKARLSSVLRPEQRVSLTLAMLKDVLLALANAKKISSVTVVSADRAVKKIAEHHRATFLWEGARRGLNKGVRLAVAKSERQGAQAVLIMHADLPLVTREEIDRFIRHAGRCEVVLTPSKDRRGTNVLFLRPPRGIPPAFGKESYRKHLSMATLRNLKPMVLRIRGLSFDLDKPRDLQELMTHRLRNETGKFLSLLGSRYAST